MLRIGAVRASWTAIAVGACAASAFAQDHRQYSTGESYGTLAAGAGIVRVEFDRDVFAQNNIPMPAEMQASDGWNSFLFGVNTAESDLVIQSRGLEVSQMTGQIVTVGEFHMSLGLAPNGELSRVGDFAVSFQSGMIRLRDRLDVQRELFVFAPTPDQMTLSADASQLVITSPLQVSWSLANEVLHTPALEGVVVGNVEINVTMNVVDWAFPAVPSAGEEGGVAGGTGNGPDVITSSISAMTLYGTVGTIAAYAMTTVSCNLGEADAEWFAGTADHPVIAQNLYRLKTVSGSKRFEQIGMSWLKHGWCAADAPSCGSPYEANGSCDWLGTHATDTYGAGLNATQTDLGPRSEVNPWAGTYPYPYVLGWNANGNAIYKRLQVEVNDINPAMNSGALYWGEGHYVCTDEQAVNRYNNVTHRVITVGSASGSAWNLNYGGSVVAQQPAINEWVPNDAGAAVTQVDVPSDGRLYVGYNVTSLGGGQYHYEYAIYNMNMHRAVQSFSIPVPSGVTVTNIGFHDVPYHSGESYSGTDWPGSVASGALTWATETFATNANANALRWGTLYNFRFDANSPPQAATGTIGLFRTGSPGSVTVSVRGPQPITVDPPVITQHPVSQAQCAGQDVTFTVAATGGAPLTYQWRLNTVNISGATSTSLTITNIDAGDAGSYDCVVTNPAGNATSNPATLTVQNIPSISVHPQSQTACSGSSVTFTVTASGNPSPVYQWQKNGVNIGGATSSSYTINPVSSGDAGNYRCVVSNACGSVNSNTAVLTVNVGANVTTDPSPQTVCAGSPASFSVVATGTPTPTYQWRKNGVNIGGATNSTYNIASTTTGDAGTYDCVVTNSCGSDTSAAGTLAVTLQADANCDGTVNNFDIDLFVTGLVEGEAAWHAAGSNCDYFCALDVNGDGSVDNFDIDPFTSCVIALGCP